MSLFRQRKHKRFNYIPRHLRESKEGEDLRTQWESVRGQGKHKGKRSVSIVMLLIVLGMIIALWFVLTHYETS
nr:hypothetical protein [uncultured Psychroserpens sp.]